MLFREVRLFEPSEGWVGTVLWSGENIFWRIEKPEAELLKEVRLQSLQPSTPGACVSTLDRINICVKIF